MNNVAVTISFILDNELKTIVLETIDDTKISASSTLTTHPMVSGDEVADHIFKNPVSLTLSGSYSLNGSNNVIVDSAGSRLENFESIFERIKDEGILCEIVKIQMSNSNFSAKDEVLFTRRSNMCLTNISWVEKINSISFTLDFTQAMLVTIQEYSVDIDDNLLPNITEPATLNFTDTFLDFNQVDSIINSSLLKFDLMTEDFAKFMSSQSATALVAMGVALAVAAVVASIPGVGWVAVAIGAAVGAAIVLVKGLINGLKGLVDRKKYTIEQFKLYNQDKKNQREVRRYCNFIGQIHEQMSQLNSAIKVYSISSDEPQECMISISDEYYIFTFTKNNVDSTYSMNVVDINEKERASVSNISGSPTSFSECSASNYLFRADSSGEYVYLVCADTDKSNLMNYFIISTSIEPVQFNDVLYNIIKNALIK